LQHFILIIFNYFKKHTVDLIGKTIINNELHAILINLGRSDGSGIYILSIKV